MNILLNNYCNLDCVYCFANKVREEQHLNMSSKNFAWLLDFVRRSKVGEIRLIGGEPTLHPEFKEFALEAAMSGIKNIHVFSNGTFSPQLGYFLMCLASKVGVSMLLNFNHPTVIGEAKTKLLHAHLQEFINSSIQVTLGINFYEPEQDYSYILQAAKMYGIKSVRWTLVVPNIEEKKTNPQDYFLNFTPLITNFIRDACSMGLIPHVDCNNIPLCLLDDATLRWLCLVAGNNTRVSVCSPVIDVTPDMQAIRCFALSDYRVNVKDFCTVQELQKHFEEHVDAMYAGKPLFDVCCDCASFQLRNKSCACLAYKNIQE